jgi:ABC-2 type transport system ATP-binding protein
MNPGWTVVETRSDGARLAFEADDPQSIAAALRKMIGDGLTVIDFHREERRLEDAFVDMIKEKSRA